MKLALIIDDYLPSSTRVGAKMFHELALELRDYGHEITVITPDFKQKERLVTTELDGIKIWRFRSGPIKNVGRIRRALNETLLSYNSWKAIKGYTEPTSFDGVVYYSPSIFWGGVVKRIKQRCSCSAYLVLRDLFPQWVIDAGMLSERSIIASYFRYFEAYSYKQAKKIGLMSEKNLEIFKQRHLQYPCEVLRNWASTQTVVGNHENYVSIRERLNLKNKVIYFYGGNIGHAQDMANLMRLAKRMQCYPDAHFLFIGQGDEVELINTLAVQWKLTNYSYLPSVGQSEFKLILTDVDVGLFSLSARHTAHNFPGKLLGYMVEALPILGSVNYGNDLQCIVNGNNAGYIHVNGEDDNLFSSAEMLYANEMLRREIGSNAKKLLVEQFSVSSAACQITKVLEE